MLGNIRKAEEIYIVCGYTDMRMGIDGLAHIIQREYQIEPFSSKLFLFCGRRSDRFKALLWEGDGFVLLYKRLEGGRVQWPRNRREAREISRQQLRWLLEGLSIDQPRANRPVGRIVL